MNHANMESVSTNSSFTNASATLVGLVLLVISTSTNAFFHLVKTEVNVLMVLMISTVFAKLVTQERGVNIQLTTAHPTHARTVHLASIK